MPSWLKLTLVALAAFGLGFAAARRFPLADPASTEDLAWERGDATVRLTAKAQGESYLIVQGDTGNADPSSKGASPAGLSPSWSVETAETINVRSPMLAYRLSPVLACLDGTCHPCLSGSDCGPLVGPFGPVGPVGPLSRMQGWFPRLDRAKPGIPDLPRDR